MFVVVEEGCLDIPDRHRLKGADRLGPIQRLLSPQSVVNDVKVLWTFQTGTAWEAPLVLVLPTTANWRLKPTRGSSLRPPSHGVDSDARTITARQLLLPSRAPTSEETGTQTGPREFERKQCLKLVTVNVINPFMYLIQSSKYLRSQCMKIIREPRISSRPAVLIVKSVHPLLHEFYLCLN